MHHRSYRDYLRLRFPAFRHVRKVTLDAGFTCPNLDGTRGKGGCSYCDNRSFSPAMAMRGSAIQEQLNAQIPRIRSKYPGAGILAYYQPYSNTYAPVWRLEEAYAPALLHPDVVGISIGTRPDCLGPEVLDLLCQISRTKPLILEVGLQSANDRALELMGRGHTRAEFEECMRACVAAIERERKAGFAGFDLATHIILGLPGDTCVNFEETARCIAAFPLSAVKIHPLHIVQGTRLARQWQLGEISVLAFEEYCQGVAAVLRIIPQEMAIERYTGDAPSDSLLAPPWCGDRNAIVRRVGEILSLNDTGLCTAEKL